MNGVIRVKPLAICIAIPLAVGALSGLLSGDMKEAYAALVQPPFAPPGWIFGVVWPILYIMMGIASYLVWESGNMPEVRAEALTFYGVQLLLNFLWGPVFFRLGLLHSAFWLLCALLVLAAVTTVSFAAIRRKTLWLMVPYVAWLLFAAVLNRAIAAIN